MYEKEPRYNEPPIVTNTSCQSLVGIPLYKGTNNYIATIMHTYIGICPTKYRFFFSFIHRCAIVSLRPPQTQKHCCETFLPKIFSRHANRKTFVAKKMFLKKTTTNYLFLGFTEAKNVSATNVSCARQQGTF